MGGQGELAHMVLGQLSSIWTKDCGEYLRLRGCAGGATHAVYTDCSTGSILLQELQVLEAYPIQGEDLVSDRYK